MSIMFHGTKLVSLGRLATIFQRSPEAIATALDELRAVPYLQLNETAYFAFAVIANLRAHFSQGERT